MPEQPAIIAPVSDDWAKTSLEALNSGDEAILAQQLRALPPELLAQAVQTAHELGNRAFKEKKYDEAVYQYTSTLTGDPSRVAAWSNRAACFSAMNQHDKALKDAEVCVQLRPDWPKGHYRVGRALLGIGGHRTVDSVLAFAKGCALDPKNKDMRTWHQTAHEAWQREAKASGATNKRRSFDTKAFDAMVKEHEAEEEAIEQALTQEEEAKNLSFEKPDGTKMTSEEMEMMLSGQDPNAGPR
jgi:tetratricopeptide (TPR) repeat protein